MKGINIGIKIKKMRINAGFNQEIIAKYLQVDQSYVSKMEKGEREVTSDILKKLSELFGCKLSSLISEEECNDSLNISFRANTLTASDLKYIASINRIALNLEYMDEFDKAEFKDEKY